MLVPRPQTRKPEPDGSGLDAFDRYITCPICNGRKAVLTITGHARTCMSCNGRGEVNEVVARQIASMSADS